MKKERRKKTEKITRLFARATLQQKQRNMYIYIYKGIWSYQGINPSRILVMKMENRGIGILMQND